MITGVSIAIKKFSLFSVIFTNDGIFGRVFEREGGRPCLQERVEWEGKFNVRFLVKIGIFLYNYIVEGVSYIVFCAIGF